MKAYLHFIDGRYVEPASQRWMDTVDPYTGEAWAKIPQGDARDVDRAVTAATRAMREGPWARMTATERGKLMLKLADLVGRNAQRLAEIEVRDNGKLLAEMHGQLEYHTPSGGATSAASRTSSRAAWCRSTSRTSSRSPGRSRSAWSAPSLPGIRRCCSSPASARRPSPPVARWW